MTWSDYIEADFCIHEVHNVLYRHYPAGWSYDHSSNSITGERYGRRNTALYYVADGELSAVINGVEYRAKKDSIVLFDAGNDCTTGCASVGSGGTLDIYIVPIRTDTAFSRLGLPVVMEGMNSCLHFFEEMYACWSAHSIAHKIRTRSMVEELVAKLLSDAAAEGMPALNHKLLHVLDYINLHYMEPLSADELCRVVNYSPSHLRRLFLKEFGIPPLRYVNKIRIRRACELLAYDNTPIWRIAELTGFENAAYFSHIFREFMHTTPGEYRRSVQLGSL